MAITEHLESFAGLNVVEWTPRAGFKPGLPGEVAYRLRGPEYDKKLPSFSEVLGAYLADSGALGTTALVIGLWDSDAATGNDSSPVVTALAAARDRLPILGALFLGDIVCEECEISWINQSNVGPLFTAFPHLFMFHIRGTAGLTFGPLRHDNLRVLTIESGGLPALVLDELWAAELPNLEHLELWLGTENYDGISDVAALAPLLSGKLFPRLRYLGLRNSDIADDVARAIVASPLLERVGVLDLSLGNLSDEGAQALLNSPAVRRLEKLDVHHHYLAPATVAALEGMGIAVDASEKQEPDVYTYKGVTESNRYNAHSE